MAGGAGETCTGVIDISSSTGGNFFVRFGLAYNLSSGSTPGQADVSVELSDDSCGAIVGSAATTLQATSTADGFIAVTRWIPALQAEKLKYAVVCNSLTGLIQYRPCYRTATTSPQDPSAWSTTMDSWRTTGEICTGELSPTVSTEMWVQGGLQTALSSGSSLGQAFFAVVVAARKG